MKTFLKGAALFVAVTCVVWIAVLWRWRATQRDMDAVDLGLYLGVLPVVIFTLALALRWAVRSALAKQVGAGAATAATAASAAAGGAPNSAAGASAQGKPPLQWHLLGAWVHTAAGTNVDELLAAIEASSPRPAPDAALQGDDGLPVMTARIAQLDTQAIESALQRIASTPAAALDGRTSAPAAAQASHTPRSLRALASLAPLIDELAGSLRAWAEGWDAATAVATKANGAAPAPEDARIVRVLASWPADWDDALCANAQAWLAERLCAPLATTLPPARWTILGQRLSGADLLSAAERTLDVLKRQGRDDPVVLMACHSDLDAAGIQALARQQRLFHSRRQPKVAFAGEGAAVLVVSAVDWPADAVIPGERVRLASPAIVRRQESIEAPGRTSSQDTVHLVQQGLASADLQGTAVAKLASDADQHTARATELFSVTLALLPALDATEDLRLAGTFAGRLEAAAPLVTLALAAAQVRACGQPALALSLADTHWRMAAVLRPASLSTAPAAT